MLFSFPRYIHGMLQTRDKGNVYGDLRGIAYSDGFSEHLRREVYKKVRPDLTADILQDSKDAFGFFSLSDNDFVAAHYQLMELTEIESRGKPIFSEYLYLTLSQLNEINWNLLPVFKFFSRIQYYEEVEKNIKPAEIEFDDGNQWLNSLHRIPVQTEAILVRYLSSVEKINIISSPSDCEFRLHMLCALIQCLPQRYRKDMSFATLAKDTSDSARIFFSSQQGRYGQKVDWQAPTIPSLPGVIYANWVVDLVRTSKVDEFKEAISKLVLPWNTEHLKTYGDELDLAIRYKDWYANRDEHLKVKVMNQLEQLAKQINDFSCIFTTQEAEGWLSFVLIFVMKLTAYDIGIELLSHYMSMISDNKSKKMLVEKIINEIFFQQKEENLHALAGFIVRITEHGVKTNQSILLDFCKEILLNCLASNDYRNALRLWVKLKKLEWVNTIVWFKAALAVLPQIQVKEDFVYILNDIGCSPDRQAFDSLLVLLRKSHILSSHLPENMRFLETLKHESPQMYLEQIAKCFFEVKSCKWLNAQIRFGYENVEDFLELIPLLISTVGEITADNLLVDAMANKDDLLVVFIRFSMLLNHIKQDKVGLMPINKYLEPIKGCKREHINIGLEILQKHWRDFSTEQLQLMLVLLEEKQHRYYNINLSVMEITTVLQKKNRIKKIQSVFNQNFKKGNLGHIVFDFVSDFSRSADVEAWNLFEKFIRDRSCLEDYQRYLVQILLENQFFDLTNNQLLRLNGLFNNVGLIYEADVFMYWLFFRKNLFANPIPTINRTLDHYCVHPDVAGRIIGYEHAFDKKHIHVLANKLVRMEPVEAEKMSENLDVFILKHPISSFQIRLKAIVSDISPEIIWAENCKLLSKYIKSELQKIPNRRI